MKLTRSLLAVCLLALAGLVACDSADDPVDSPALEPIDEQAASAVLETDQMVDQVVADELARLDRVAAATTGGTVVDDVSFSRTVACPAGGELRVDGQLHRVFDRDTLTMEATFSGTETREDCAFVRGEHIITVNGSSSWEAFRRRVDGVPDGPQTSAYSGSFEAVRDDGRSRSCSFDVEVVRDPDSRTRTVDGAWCGTEFHRTTTWNPE